jgi:hypothetical protein
MIILSAVWWTSASIPTLITPDPVTTGFLVVAVAGMPTTMAKALLANATGAKPTMFLPVLRGRGMSRCPMHSARDAKNGIDLPPRNWRKWIGSTMTGIGERMANEKLPPVIEAAIAEYNRVYTAIKAAEESLNADYSVEYGTLCRQKLVLEEVLGAYKYMLDWNPKTKQFTVYLDK